MMCNKLPSSSIVYFAVLGLLLVGCRGEPSHTEEASRPAETPARAGQERPSAGSLATTVPAQPSLPPAPREAPEVALTTLDGETFTLQDRRGEVVLVNFWATWCAPCRVEIPDLIQLQETMGAQGLTVVGISEDLGGAEVVRPFLENHPVNYPVVLDPKGELAEAFGGVFGLPTTFVIGPDGRIVNRTLGIFPIEKMKPRLKELLASER